METIKQVRFEIIESNLLNEQKALFKAINGLDARICWAAAARDKARLKELRREGESIAFWSAALLKAFKKIYTDNKYLVNGQPVIDNHSDVHNELINVVYF